MRLWIWPLNDLQGFRTKFYLIFLQSFLLKYLHSVLRTALLRVWETGGSLFATLLGKGKKGRLEFIWRVRRVQVLEDFLIICSSKSLGLF